MSIYDIKISSWDGSTDDLLSEYKGKVTLITNVTGDCGNAPQFRIIEEIYDKYKDQGFEVLAVPTNQYCGNGITYGEFADGLSAAGQARTYAMDNYDVTYKFTELVNSKPGEGWFKQLPEGEEAHELFATLCGTNNKDMFGNFEKFLVDQNGVLVGRYENGALLTYIYDNQDENVNSAVETRKQIESDIEKALAGELLPL